MSRRCKEEAAKTRKRILASALALFAKKGYEHVTFTDIAARLKMTKGAVYWHFATKEVLLMALVDEMLRKFGRLQSELKAGSELTFPVVAEMLVAHAEQLVADPKGAAFFLLLQTQIKWRADSMAQVREHLLSDRTQGPYHLFLQALENDLAAGKVRARTDPVAVASSAVALWSGLVRSKIEHFLECDLAAALRGAYRAMWAAVAAE